MEWIFASPLGARHKLAGNFAQEANSYHQYGFAELPPQLMAMAQSDDGVVESFRHVSKPIYGIMWHPERENPFRQSDKDFVTKVFSPESSES
ncbi:MAG: gamma-glutamyl-gamma-aminobutyrate hydrolase family protein [Acidaminococcales bacterium]|nr:gamma-glutamyl-gamma-aminobutyrate hydrolase family protein [Acidaminococcales bacterium]